MGLQTIQEKRIRKIKRFLHLTQGQSKSRLAHVTGLHFFVVEDILNYLKREGQVEEEKKQWRLKQ